MNQKEIDAENFRLAREVVYSRDEERYGGAQEILLDLARKGYKEAASVFGLLAVLSGIPSEIEKGLHILQAGYYANDKASICNLGAIYQEGLSGEVNYKKAIEYFVKAGELGSGSAWFNYGTMIVNGQGVERDLAKAELCFIKAARLGSESAKTILRELKGSHL